MIFNKIVFHLCKEPFLSLNKQKTPKVSKEHLYVIIWKTQQHFHSTVSPIRNLSEQFLGIFFPVKDINQSI